MLAMARTFTLLGVEAHEVRVEADVRMGLPSFTLVGLPDAAVRESRERVRPAIVNSGFEFPQRRITANLAPADLRKAGPGFDLALAAAVLAATGQIQASALADLVLAGELALDGSLHPVPGTLAMAEAAVQGGARAIVVPSASAAEAALVAQASVIGIDRLDQLVLLGGSAEPAAASASELLTTALDGPDLADLRGQPALRHALELAAAGGHSLLISGPPGAGKSMAARRLPSILPPLDQSERIEAARVASACGLPVEPAISGRRPFRAPHHTISAAGLVGGGNPPRPGEVTLAHRGVLFLDELPEFARPPLEAMRQPLEDGSVRIARARYAVELPARFQLIAAANPCPCGRGPESGECRCTITAVRAYESRLTGALADRIDISLVVAQPDLREFTEPGESSAVVQDRVLAARERQLRRGTPANALCRVDDIELAADAALLVEEAGTATGLSGRGRDRVIRVARTLADLADRDVVGEEDIAGALSLRRRHLKPTVAA
jgi:magnesium chelatase family protein